jgi:hypothetical protein
MTKRGARCPEGRLRWRWRRNHSGLLFDSSFGFRASSLLGRPIGKTCSGLLGPLHDYTHAASSARIRRPPRPPGIRGLRCCYSRTARARPRGPPPGWAEANGTFLSWDSPCAARPLHSTGAQGRRHEQKSAAGAGAWTLAGRRPATARLWPCQGAGAWTLAGRRRPRHGPCQGGDRCGQVRIDKEYA